MTIIKSHTYSIVLEQVCYFREDSHNQTLFTMTNGRKVRITCPYDEVLSQIHSSNGEGIIVLDYPVRISPLAEALFATPEVRD